MRDSFIFYKSFYEAIKDLPRDVQGEVYTAIMEYSFNGITTGQLKPIARSIFTLMKPQLDANRARYENGSKGGRPKKETEQKPNNNLDETKSEPNKNDNVNDNHNANGNENNNDLLLEKEAKDALLENSNPGPAEADDPEKEKSSAKKEKEFGKAEFLKVLLQLGVDQQHAKDWIKVREKKKSVLTQTALRKIVESCEQNNFPFAEAIKISAEKGWAGFSYNWVLNDDELNKKYNGQSVNNHPNGSNAKIDVKGALGRIAERYQPE